MAGKTILILGGGVGGLTVAHDLRRRLGSEHRVVVVDREGQHRFQASYLWLMMGWRRPDAISRELTVLKSWGIDFRQAEVQYIDVNRQVVDTSVGAIPYDYLVVALGADLASDSLPGLVEGGYTPYDFSDAIRLGSALGRLDEGALAIVIASTPFKCPAAPYEAALLLDESLRRRRVRRRVVMSIYTPEAFPMPVAGHAVGQALVRLLEAREIQFNHGYKLAAVNADHRRLIFENESEVGFDFLGYVPPHRPPAVVIESGLCDDAGWIPVDRNTLETSRDHIYAIGDVAAVKLPNGMMLPKAGVFAHAEAQVVAHNIAIDIGGHGRKAFFDGWGACFIETGGGRAAYGSGYFFNDPSPQVQLFEPARSWHMGKVFLEKAWLSALSPSPLIAQGAFTAMNFGMRTLLEQPWLWRRF